MILRGKALDRISVYHHVPRSDGNNGRHLQALSAAAMCRVIARSVVHHDTLDCSVAFPLHLAPVEMRNSGLSSRDMFMHLSLQA